MLDMAVGSSDRDGGESGAAWPSDSAADAAQRARQQMELGRAAHLAGRLGEAAELYDAALRVLPHDAELRHLRGALAWSLGDLVEARAHVEAALRLRPAYAAALNTLGVVNQAQGRQDDAVTAFADAHSADPATATYLGNLASTLVDVGEGPRAIALLQGALATNPEAARVHRMLGDALIRLNQPAASVAAMQRAVALDPENVEHRFVLAHACQLAGDLAGAIAGYEAVLEAAPSHHRALQNLGRAYCDIGDAVRGFQCLERAVAAAPGNGECLANLAVALRRQNRLAEALEHYDRAIELDPDNARTRYHHALTLLLAGSFDRGWREHEWRKRVPGFPVRRDLDHVPAWDGTPLAGRCLLLHAEQGLGDTIQFVRYAMLIGLSGLAAGSRIVLMVQQELCDLLEGLPGVAAVVASSAAPPVCDVQAALLSLPLLMGTSADRIPAAVPYIRAGNWAGEALGPSDGLRCAVAWAGNPTHGNDTDRSLSPDWARVLGERLLQAKPGLRLFGVQVGARAGDLEPLVATGRYRSIAPGIGGFGDTAAALAQMDVVVSVDTSVAHLAGALGRRTLVLLPFAPDWRWLSAGRTTPWYPSMRLCRAAGLGDPSSAVAQAVEQVRDRLAAA